VLIRIYEKLFRYIIPTVVLENTNNHVNTTVNNCVKSAGDEVKISNGRRKCSGIAENKKAVDLTLLASLLSILVLFVCSEDYCV
jgi:hypothetical protein